MTVESRRHGCTLRLPVRWRGVIRGAAGLWLACLAATAQAACLIPVGADYLDAISREPRIILESNPQGGQQLVYRAQMLAAANIRSLRDLMVAAPSGNQAQKAAIGEGLGRAAAACNSRYGDVARRIMDSVRALGDRDVSRAFHRVLTPDAGRAAGSPLPRGDDGSSRSRLGMERDLRGRNFSLGNPFANP